MKASVLSRFMAFGTLVVVGSISFSCKKDSGNPGYDITYNPSTSTDSVPSLNLDQGADNALDGLASGQHTLENANIAAQNGESGTLGLVPNGTSSAARAADGFIMDTGSGGVTDSSSSSGAGSKVGSLSDSSGNGRSSGSFSGNSASGSGGGAGGAGALGNGGIASLGDTRTAAAIDPSKMGPNGDGSMSAMDALGRSNGSVGQAAYAAGGGGGRSSDRGGGYNPFGFGGDGDGVGGKGGSSISEISRDPASLAAQADAARNGKDPMGSQDPSNYFSLISAGDNLFKIVERRYTSKSRQWELSDVQEIRRSVQK